MERDNDKRFGKNLEVADPSDQWIAVVPHASNPLPEGKPNYIYVGTSGDLVVAGDDENNVTFKSLAVGFHPIRPKFVRASSTAADIVAVY